jgi:hypothetical protein
VMGAVIEFEKRQAVKRMRDGMLAKAALVESHRPVRICYQGAGKGRERDAARDPDEQETIHEIMGLRSVNASYRVIATALNDSGHRPKRAKRWSPMTVKRIYDRGTKRASPPLKDTLVATLMDDQMLIPHSGQPVGHAGGGPRVPRSNLLAQAEYVVVDEVVN